MESREPCRGVSGQGINANGSGLSADPAWLLILRGLCVAFWDHLMKKYLETLWDEVLRGQARKGRVK